MVPRRKRVKMKEWLSGFFSSKREMRSPNGLADGGTSFTNIATDSAIHVYGDNNTVMRQDGYTIETQIMSLLSQHVIRGAAHDDSARDPPPLCHPNTRVKLIARITTWFDGKAQRELLLWITGPAGVGKSAVVQTFAEYLAKSKSLGASVFISRPNRRNKPEGIFITIAYQLATRIMEYRKFIAERLSLDPSLLNKGLAAQFATLIVEPFVEKKIGAGGPRWGILLDGLDELEGENAQRNIIRLISNFVLEHRAAPLVWLIASRPESHIWNTFDHGEIRRSRWMEYIPIDSTEACSDVERFLRTSFKTVQDDFRHSVHSDWPSDTDFLKLTAAASGLFVYAQVVMQFIGDPNLGDPISRFQVLLSVIDRSNAVPTEENPFVHLDALYNAILSSIPSTLWPTAKRVLGIAIHVEDLSNYSASSRRILGHSKNLRGISILFGIPRHIIYACLSKCRSTLEIPDWKAAHRQSLKFLHASFVDYLKDSSRSGEFYVGNAKNALQAVTSDVLETWNRFTEDDVAAVSVESTWHQYCSRFDDKSPSKEITQLHANMFCDMVDFVEQKLYRTFWATIESLRYSELYKVNMTKLYYSFNRDQSLRFVRHLVTPAPESPDTRFLQVISLRDLCFDHLDWKEMSPSYVLDVMPGGEKGPIFHRPRSKPQLEAFMSELDSLRGHSPQLKVYVFGSVPKGRVAGFCRTLNKELEADKNYMYYVIPYPE